MLTVNLVIKKPLIEILGIDFKADSIALLPLDIVRITDEALTVAYNAPNFVAVAILDCSALLLDKTTEGWYLVREAD